MFCFFGLDGHRLWLRCVFPSLKGLLIDKLCRINCFYVVYSTLCLIIGKETSIYYFIFLFVGNTSFIWEGLYVVCVGNALYLFSVFELFSTEGSLDPKSSKVNVSRVMFCSFNYLLIVSPLMILSLSVVLLLLLFFGFMM